jgi:hypothetical protein
MTRAVFISLAICSFLTAPGCQRDKSSASPDDATADEDFAPKEDFSPDEEEAGGGGGGGEEEAAPNLKKRKFCDYC